MTLLGTLLKKGIKLRESFDKEKGSPSQLQEKQLRNILGKASATAIGNDYKFKDILATPEGNIRELYQKYKTVLPVFDYNKIYEAYWHRTRTGEKDICWPGQVRYFALSSGTSEASSKYIPVTNDMLKAIRKTSIRQILSLSRYDDLPTELFTKKILMLGGSTDLHDAGNYFEGDLSGITTSKLPYWFQNFYKPGQKIAKAKDWEEKLTEITRKAKDWDIGVIVGVPAWLQILMERILEFYKVETIHDIWPNLSIFVHGGVAFDPYRKSFEKLLARPLVYMETYLASEGFIAYQSKPRQGAMDLVLDNGIFTEFVPFNTQNFNADGSIKEGAEALMINEVEEGKEYAVLLTTVAGAYRYLIGDVVKIVSKEDHEIQITGRTKHFLSLCGEHLSVDNMTKAINKVAEELNLTIKEFTVAGIPYNSLFAHHWIIGTDAEVDCQTVKKSLDHHLKELNDDYATERKHALQEVLVDVVPNRFFYDFLEQGGKVGGQNKFPRVVKGEQYQAILNFKEDYGT
jgi:hypothetical protein